MLSIQYYNSRLSKKQLDKILNNYNLKYSTMKNEIDAKFNSLINVFLTDIKAFLENIEEISNERQKIKNLETNQREIDSLRHKLQEKLFSEHQLMIDLDLLKKENSLLKSKMYQSNTSTITNYNNNSSLNISVPISRKKYIKPKNNKNSLESRNTQLNNTELKSTKTKKTIHHRGKQKSLDIGYEKTTYNLNRNNLKRSKRDLLKSTSIETKNKINTQNKPITQRTEGKAI